MRSRPTCTEIAESLILWQEYVDPDANSPEEFDSMSTEEKVALIHSLWPEDCHC